MSYSELLSCVKVTFDKMTEFKLKKIEILTEIKSRRWQRSWWARV